MKMKLSIIALLLAASLSLCACGGKDSSAKEKKAPETEKISQTNTEPAESGESVPDGEFTELPGEAEEDFNYVAEVSSKLFPDTKGKKMYGYEGLEEIATADGDKSCYIFDFYTYKSKLYNKVAKIAKDSESSDIYLFNEENGEYELTELPQRETDWHEKATAALAADTQNGAVNEMPGENTAE